MKILVIGGGISDEREVSLKSSRAVFEAALDKGYEAEFYDWDGSEHWLAKNVKKFSAILPILHGTGGEDGEIQQILEKSGAAYLGADSQASKLCFDKEKTRALLASSGIMVPKGRLVTLKEYQADKLFNLPHVLKPFNSGSSVDTFIYPDPDRRNLEAVNAAFKRHDTLLLEQFIKGTEITVPLLDGRTLPIIEIIPPENGVFDFENKYNGQTQELVPPQNVSEELQEQARRLGEEVHRLTGCRHLSRVDMIIASETPYVLEVNTLPGMTSQSLFPKAALAAGMDFPELVDYLIKMVVNNES